MTLGAAPTGAVRTVTALRAVDRRRVAVELDGQPWRTLPHEAVVRAGLAPGVPLERSRVRVLARERRRLTALRTATAALARRGHSSSELDERLRARGVARAERELTLEALLSAGLVDDGRFARERARALADRGAGDALVRADLEQRGVGEGAVAAALAALRPERERAAEIIARRGSGAKTARYLAARGFDEDVVAAAVAREDGAALG